MKLRKELWFGLSIMALVVGGAACALTWRKLAPAGH